GDRGPVILISNSPRPATAVAEQLDAIGVPRTAWSSLVTSGDATRLLLAERAPGPAWAIGPDRDAVLYCGLGLKFADLGAARFISCSGLFDDQNETPDHYRERLTRAASLGLEMICANPDVMVQRGERVVWCGGALAQLYEGIGGRVLMAGKPNAPIYELASSRAASMIGGAPDRERILVIGDGVPTDIAGARAQRLASLFIATGMHGAAALDPGGRLDSTKAEALLAKAGTDADFVMAELLW
ncbi:MAG: HAD hydrolase-like protein, partial [Caulobacteraceae bacterium]